MIHSFFDDVRRNKEAAEKRTVTIRTIAEETGLSLLELAQVQNVMTERIRLSTLEKLCNYFKLRSISELVEFIPQERVMRSFSAAYYESPSCGSDNQAIDANR